MNKPFYVTTPIYYVTDAPHIGHLYTTVAADITARYHRMLGDSVHFLTGTDEHGQKMEKKAKETGETPQALADRVVVRYIDAWKKFNISNDDFIRTTEDRHKKIVQQYVKQLMDKGDIYLGSYEGLYCVPCETYLTKSQLADGKCPQCGRAVETLKEESYFFKMSAYEEKLLKHIEANPDFIMPESRKNEVLGFIKQGLKDISMSRTTIEWGIPMPEDSRVAKPHKVYVWFDALTNYASALDPNNPKSLFKTHWKEAIHIVGKDILRFHAVYWPTFLMALDLPVPKQIVAHGWLTDSNRKISKSMGNAVDPMKLAETLGVDPIRYFLFREFVFGLDGEYTQESVYHRINSDLANDFGNCINRTTNMIQKYFGEDAIEITEALKRNTELQNLVEQVIPQYHAFIKRYEFNKALECLWQVMTYVNKSIETNAPWKLAKSQDPKDQEKLKDLLLGWAEGLRISSLLLWPFMPASIEKAMEFLGDESSLKQPAALTKIGWGSGPQKIQVKKGEILFPRFEVPKE